jgi:coenzyme F420 biosynthesis associated uncharacterized protein
VTTEPIDWALAGRVARRVAGRKGPFDPVVRASMEAQFADLSAHAEDLVAAETGLRSLSGPARARVVDRQQWSEANVASFRRLLTPLTAKLADQFARARGPMSVARRIAGTEVGALLGWMSARVLGQYDLLLVEDIDTDEQDLVYYVGPNVAALETRFGFPPDEFRLWLAVHELTHRAQFTGVEWMRPHFLHLVSETLGSFDTDPQRFLQAIRSARGAGGSKAIADGGVMALLATPEQRERLDAISGMMSLLEGHGDVTMNRAAVSHIPSAERFARVLAERRRSQGGASRVFQRLLGLEAKMAQYEQGERFIAEIEAADGPRAVDRCWVGPTNLPSLEEIRDPRRWLDRIHVANAAVIDQ